MCQCYQVGGPFIEEDPDCPFHGRQAQLEQRLREEVREADEQSREELEEEVVELRQRVTRLEEVCLEILTHMREIKIQLSLTGNE